MKTEYRIYAAIALLAVLGVGYWLTRKSDQEEQAARTTDAAETLPTIALAEADAANVTKLQITNADKGDVVLEKKGDKWRLTAPVDAEANQKFVEDLLGNMKTLAATEMIDRGTESYEQYDLTDAKAVHLQAFNGESKLVDLYFGKAGKRGQLARQAGTDGVFVADKYQGFLYARETKNWRNMDLLKIEDKNVIQVEIENEHGKFSFSKNEEEWSGTFAERDDDGGLKKASSEWESFDPKKVATMLGAFKNLRATDFAEKDADTGVGSAKESGGVIKLVLKDNAGEHVLHVGKVQEGKNRFAKLDGGEETVVLSDWTVKWAIAEKDMFESLPDEDGADGGGDMDLEGLDMPGLPPGLEGLH